MNHKLDETRARAAATPGPWRVQTVFGAPQAEWRVTNGRQTYSPFYREAEALAVRDALNRLAAQAPEGNKTYDNTTV